MNPARRRTALAVPLLLAPLLLAACASGAAPAGFPQPSSSHSSSNSAAAPSTTSTPATNDAATGPALSVKTGTELCALVPLADAQAAEKPTPAFSSRSGITGSYDDPECDYGSADKSVDVSVLVYPASEVPFVSTHSYLNQVAATPVPGVGAGASGSAAEVDVDLGDRFTLIVYSSTEFGGPQPGAVTTDGLTALAKLFVAKLS